MRSSAFARTQQNACGMFNNIKTIRHYSTISILYLSREIVVACPACPVPYSPGQQPAAASHYPDTRPDEIPDPRTRRALTQHRHRHQHAHCVLRSASVRRKTVLLAICYQNFLSCSVTGGRGAWPPWTTARRTSGGHHALVTRSADWQEQTTVKVYINGWRACSRVVAAATKFCRPSLCLFIVWMGLD